MRLLKVFILCLVFLACGEDSPEAPSNEITIQHQESVTKTINGKEWNVSFPSIIENSLCPEDVTCVWLGRLVIQLDINNILYILGTGDLSTNTEEEYPSELMIDGVTVSILNATATQEAETTKITLVFE